MRLEIDPNWQVWLVNDEVYAACERGWRNIVHDLLRSFHNVFIYSATSDARIRILQIKEKFAGLRLYWREENVTGTTQRALQDLPARSGSLLPDLRDMRTTWEAARAWGLAFHAMPGSYRVINLVVMPKGAIGPKTCDSPSMASI